MEQVEMVKKQSNTTKNVMCIKCVTQIFLRDTSPPPAPALILKVTVHTGLANGTSLSL